MRSVAAAFIIALSAFSVFANTPESAVRDGYQQNTARRMRGARCITVEHGHIDSLRIDGIHAHAEATAVVHAVSVVDGREREWVDHVVVDLRKSGGRWRIREWKPAAEIFAETIAHAGARRQQLIDANPLLITPDVARAVAVQAIKGLNKDRRDAAALNAIAQQLADRTGDDAAEAIVLATRSNIDRDSGAPRKALDLANAALEAALRSGDADTLARIYGTIGRAYVQIDRHSPEARAYYDKAAALADYVSDGTINDRTYAYIGRWYLIRDDYLTARAYYKKSLDLARALHDVPGIAASSNALAATYADVGQYDLAIPIIERDLWAVKGLYYEPLYRAILAGWYLDQGKDLAKATKMIRRASEDAKRTGGTWNRAIALELTGNLYKLQHRYDEAEAAYKEASAILVKDGGTGIEPLADVAEERGDYAGAVKYALQYAEATRGKNPYVFVAEMTLAARAQRAMGNDAAALSELREAVGTAEEFWEDISAKARPQSRLFDEYFEAHHELADLLVALHRPAEALRMSEMAKGRVLVEIARNGRPDASRPLSPEDHQREAQLQKRVTDLNLALIAAPDDDAAVASIRQELDDAERDVDLFEDNLAAFHPQARYGRASSPIPSGNAIAGLLGPDDAVLEYSVNQHALDIFVVRRSGDGAARTIAVRSDLKLDRLRKLALRYRSELARNEIAYQRDSQSLYKILVAPVAGELNGVRRLCIIPADVLWDVPYESLLDPNGRFLIERFAIEYSPSVAVRFAMKAHRHAPAVRMLLACGDPAVATRTRNDLESFYRGIRLGPLPAAADEVRRIAQLYGSGSECLIGSKATEGMVKAHASEYRILHFATHAIFDDKNPMYSRLVLAPDPATGDDGLLQSWEIMNLDLHAKLVVLSACDTAEGRIGAGEGLMGMAWGFLAAGARSTVASQWAVSSSATRDLMLRFHEALHAQPDGDTAAALQIAKVDILHKSRYRHPFYWAAFTLVSADD